MTSVNDPAGESALRHVPHMGVIRVVADAMKLGFYNGHPQWANLGQGQPETGEIPGAPARQTSIQIEPGDHMYGPVNGIDALRARIAEHYNRLYRVGMPSQYGPENVAVVAGGRLALSRIFACVGALNFGYQVPDYSAYEDMLDYHRYRFTPVMVRTKEEHGFRIPADHFDRIVREQGLGAFILSNPCNPTGSVIRDDELCRYAATARRRRCLLILDEFYSHFIYDSHGRPGKAGVSCAAIVEDVNADAILIVDGLTKSFRYPGWRVGWVLGPADAIDAIGRAASAIDGGAPVVMQKAALSVLEPTTADQETAAVRAVFARKRAIMREALMAMGVRMPTESQGSFYLWGAIDKLPQPLNDGERFFRAALERRVMIVPGALFDVNPGRSRRGPSPLAGWVRFSFGPPEDNMIAGLERLRRLVEDAYAGKLPAS